MHENGIQFSLDLTAGHEPIFIRPDNKHVKLRVIGDIPYLTEAVSIAARAKGIEPFRTLPAIPAMVVEAGNRIAFEWPRYCTGWRSTRMWEYAVARDLWVVDFDGCIVGMRNRHGQPIKKMWRIIANCGTLAMTLA